MQTSLNPHFNQTTHLSFSIPYSVCPQTFKSGSNFNFSVFFFFSGRKITEFWEHLNLITTIYNRTEPEFPENASYISSSENILEYNVCFYALLLCHWLFSNDDQRVPSISWFSSSTGSEQERKTTTTHQPITQYKTVLLQQSEEATKAVGQKYLINIFNLGDCMKELTLILVFLDKFKEHLVIPGPFHWETNFIGMLTNNKMQGTGYVEITEEVWLVTKDCTKNALTEKAFTKALFSLRGVKEALEHMLLEVLCWVENVKIYPVWLLSLIDSCNRSNLNVVLNDQSTMSSFKFLKFRIS